MGKPANPDSTFPTVGPVNSLNRQYCDLPDCLEQARVEVSFEPISHEVYPYRLCSHHAELLADRLQDLLRTLPDAR